MALAIIPARLASTRFPEKVLASETGRPMVQHVVEQVQRARRIERVWVAADDPRIPAALAPFGTDVVLTSPMHANGTSRLREALAIVGQQGAPGAIEAESIIVNVQADEPEIDPEAIDTLVDTLEACDPRRIPMATLAGPFAAEDDPGAPEIVKVTTRADGTAHDFTRAWPSNRHGDEPTFSFVTNEPARKHIGVYAYRAHFLDTYAELAPTPRERSERLEQLRVVEHGLPIAVAGVSTAHHGIDTPEQYRAFVERFRRRDHDEVQAPPERSATA